jgi:hypothetical protein
MTLTLLTFSTKFREIVIYQNYMNLETVLSDTYYIQIQKLTETEYHNTIIINWHRTLTCPAQDLSPTQLVGVYPHVTCHEMNNYKIEESLKVYIFEK